MSGVRNACSQKRTAWRLSSKGLAPIQVPKAIMHLLVNHSKDVVQNRLVSELYKEELFNELLYEDDGIKAEREKCERLLETYKEAAKIIGEVL